MVALEGSVSLGSLIITSLCAFQEMYEAHQLYGYPVRRQPFHHSSATSLRLPSISDLRKGGSCDVPHEVSSERAGEVTVGRYGRAAVRATGFFHDSLVDSPQDAWEQATAEQFPDSTSSQEKGCPRGAFLGLCEEGLVRGIRSGHYTRSQKNKRYAVDAVALLQADPSLAHHEALLWSRAVAGENIAPNAQMDVVIALWDNGLINSPTI
jgi:hypothetical protein